MITPGEIEPVAYDKSASSLSSAIDYNWIRGIGPHLMPVWRCLMVLNMHSFGGDCGNCIACCKDLGFYF